MQFFYYGRHCSSQTVHPIFPDRELQSDLQIRPMKTVLVNLASHTRYLNTRCFFYYKSPDRFIYSWWLLCCLVIGWRPRSEEKTKKKGVNLKIFKCINMFVQKIYLTKRNNHQTTPNVISGLRCFFLFSQTLFLTFYVIIGFFLLMAQNYVSKMTIGEIFLVS